MKFKSLLCAGWAVCLGFGPLATKSAAQWVRDLGVTIAWDANLEPGVAGYLVYAGRASRTYDAVIDAGRETSVRVAPLEAGIRFFFSVTAYDDTGLESVFSEEIEYVLPIDNANASLAPLRVIANGAGPVTIEFNKEFGRTFLIQATADLRNWETLKTFDALELGPIAWIDEASMGQSHRFYRVVSQIVPATPPDNLLDGTEAP